MTQTLAQQREGATREGLGAQVPFDAIDDPGCYVCNWSGHLLRVPEDGIKPGGSPLLSMTGREPLSVTKISDNPFITLSKARLVSADYDVNVNF